MADKKTYKCWICGREYIDLDAMLDHVEKEHKEELYNLPVQQVYFNWKNRYSLDKKFGKSVISGKPTPFNIVTNRYERFASDDEREQYRNLFKQRMEKIYGKDTLLNDPEQQKKMLANRHISGIYIWSDGKHKTLYTGSYEHKFLEFLDITLDWKNPEDIMAPAPMIFPYIDPETKKVRFHIPDFYISSINTIINIKSSENMHYRLRDIETEKAQDAAISKSNFNYIKIYDNEFTSFSSVIDKIRNSDKQVVVESIYIFNKNQELLNE